MVITVSAAVLITSYARYATAPREDWRGLAAMFEEHLKPSDCVIVDGNVEPLFYYYRKNVSCLSVIRHPTADLQNSFGTRLYVVSSYRLSSQADQILEALRVRRWFIRQNFQFHGLRVLELAEQP